MNSVTKCQCDYIFLCDVVNLLVIIFCSGSTPSSEVTMETFDNLVSEVPSLSSEEEELIIEEIEGRIIQDLLKDERRRHRIPRNTFHVKGHEWVMHVLTGHHMRCKDEFRVSCQIFRSLTRVLKENTGLQNTRNTTVEEQLAMFLLVLGHGATNRHLMERFQHSGETISRFVGGVLDHVLHLQKNLIHMPTVDAPTPDRIATNKKFYPYFKVSSENCILTY